MPKRWNTYCAVVVAFALSGCSTYRDVRDWWTEDQTAPTEEEWAAYRELYRGEGEAPVSQPAADPARVAAREPARRPAPIQETRLAPIAKKQPKMENARVANRPAAVPPAPTLTPEPPPLQETASVTETPILPPSLVSVRGMSEVRLREVLGPPTTTTERGTQRIWKYAGNGCSVEVILFRDVTRNTYAALDQRTLAPDHRTRSGPCLRAAPVQGPTG